MAAGNSINNAGAAAFDSADNAYLAGDTTGSGWPHHRRLVVEKKAGREVVAEALAHRSALGRGAEAIDLIVLNRVAVLMQAD